MRSLLFIPGDSKRKLSKASNSHADAIILDLEDSVATANKQQAREITAAYLNEDADQSAPTPCVRVNAMDTGHWLHDLDAIAATPPPLVMLPKARGGGDLTEFSSALQERGMNDTRIVPLISEVPVSLLRLETYVTTRAPIEAMTWGAEDLSVELGARTNRNEAGNFTSPYQLVRNLTLITAAAADVSAIDTVFTNFRDMDGLAREAAVAARDGFTGKLAIHPAQVAPINAAFTPTADQCKRAEAIVSAFSEAGDTIGVINFDGEMIDEPHRRQAERILARAQRYA